MNEYSFGGGNEFSHFSSLMPTDNRGKRNKNSKHSTTVACPQTNIRLFLKHFLQWIYGGQPRLLTSHWGQGAFAPDPILHPSTSNPLKTFKINIWLWKPEMCLPNRSSYFFISIIIPSKFCSFPSLTNHFMPLTMWKLSAKVFEDLQVTDVLSRSVPGSIPCVGI